MQISKLKGNHKFIGVTEIHIIKKNRHLILLTVPKFRKDKAEYLEKNCFVV